MALKGNNKQSQLIICNKKHTYCYFAYFSKAFDFLNNDLILFCLKVIGRPNDFFVMFIETEVADRINDFFCRINTFCIIKSTISSVKPSFMRVVSGQYMYACYIL